VQKKKDATKHQDPKLRDFSSLAFHAQQGVKTQIMTEDHVPTNHYY